METILNTVFIFTAISALMALLLTIADRTIANYGQVTLTINDDKVFTVQGGSSLLDTLRSEKIFIPSACGGKGTCGYCKVIVIEGGGPILKTELPMLTEEEIASNTRLSCQCKVKENIKIVIADELFNVKEYPANVVKMEQVTNTIKHLRLDISPMEINFKPGQYVQLKAPAYEGNEEEVYRAYSIASSVKDKHAIELLIGFTGGIATTYVHQHLKEGDQVHINGPYGDFYYHEDDDGPMILAGAGTGMAPLLSILQYLEDNHIQREVYLFYGAKNMGDLLFTEKIKSFEKTLERFRYLPTLSREESEEWKGDKGRVPSSIEKYIEQDGNYTAYLCGSPVMIESISEALMKKGISKDKIYFDEF